MTLTPPIKLTARTADRFVLYENAVQAVDSTLDFLARTFRRKRRRPLRVLREDFCGTAQQSCAWVRRSSRHVGWAVDLHGPTLAWCRRHRFPLLGGATERLHLVCADVREAEVPAVDAVCAFNFSFNAILERSELHRYFRKVHEALQADGIFFLDEFGGPESHKNVLETRKVEDGTMPDGSLLEPFTYEWQQERYNPITHHLTSHIHFAFEDGSRLHPAFSYRWRLWTVPELLDLLEETGFASTEVYLQGWDEETQDTDGIFRRRTRYDDWDSWHGYVVALK
jgi:SAM-dependent methyltransferase